MDIADDIIRLTDYIEGNLAERLSLDDLSSRANISKFYLHRMFKTVTGQTPGAYMLSRRLAASLKYLSETGLRTSDIAAELGFYDHSAFSHAFAKEFGISPSQFRKQPRDLPVRGRLSAADIYGSGDAIIARPTFVSKPAFVVTGMPCQIFYLDNIKYNKANLAGIDFFDNHRRKIEGKLADNVYIGLTLLPEHDEWFSWYIPSAEVRVGSPIPDGMVQHRIPAQEYAVFHYVGFHRRDQITYRILPMFQQVLFRWIPQTRFMPRSLFFERIDLSKCSEEYYEVDLYCSLLPEQIEVNV